MTLEWIDVADNAVKIGLGSLLTLAGGGVTLKLTQRHEFKKEYITQKRKDYDIKAERYINFLSGGRKLMQKNMLAAFRPDGEDYIEFTRQHEIIAITSDKSVTRELAFNAYISVSEASSRSTAERIERKPFRDKAFDDLGIFQKHVNEELKLEKAAIDDLVRRYSWWHRLR
ncbi:TPA: hypothetical protein L9K41_004657 [Klebsiella pneumoniae]|nr:hypothetical protein [Klebsiella pneumoniae]